MSHLAGTSCRFSFLSFLSFVVICFLRLGPTFQWIAYILSIFICLNKPSSEFELLWVDQHALKMALPFCSVRLAKRVYIRSGFELQRCTELCNPMLGAHGCARNCSPRLLPQCDDGCRDRTCYDSALATTARRWLSPWGLSDGKLRSVGARWGSLSLHESCNGELQDVVMRHVYCLRQHRCSGETSSCQG